MGKNEKTSPPVASLAAAVLAGKKPSPAQILTLAGAALTQAPDHRPPPRTPPRAPAKKR